MRLNLIAPAVLSSLIFLSACNRSIVHLDYTNAKDEVPPLGNLIFRFDRALVNDSLTDRWDSTEYIHFEPAIDGRFRWEHPDELVFSPSKPLAAATSFRASLRDDILQYSKINKIGRAAPLLFHTPFLALENSHAAWVIPDGNSHHAVPQLDLFFNYPVDPAAIREKLKLSIDGHPVGFDLQTLSSSTRISLRMQDVKMEDKDYETGILLEKGLVPEGGSNGSPESISSSTLVPSPFVLKINEVTAEQDGLGGSIRVTTSQQVVATDLATYVKMSPQVKINVEPQDDGFLIRSENINAATAYLLTIRKGLRGQVGGVLQEDYNSNLAFGEIEPSVSFVNSKGIYLSGKGEKNIEVRITNLDKVKIVISKIYENNLLNAQSNGYSPQETNASGEDDGEERAAGLTAGDVIYEQVVDSRTLPKYGSSRLLNFSIPDKLPDLKGIYHIMIRSTKDYWVRDSRFLSLSDIGLIARETSDKLIVFANSIQTTTPLKGVSIIAYGANNQVLAVGSTNGEGVAELACGHREFAGFRPAMVIAKTAGDFNYLPFSATRINTSRFDVGGKQSSRSGLDAFIYPERDIYRPGEKINFSVIVRDRQWLPPGQMPVKMKFLLPNGKELKSFRKTLNEQGSADGSIDLAVSAITGTYSLELYSSNDVLLSTQAFRVEEFVPDRIRVTAKLDKDDLEPGANTDLQIKAENFFGPPAADRNYECEIQVKQRAFNPKKYGRYEFSLTNQRSFFDKALRQGKTNSQGIARENYEVPAMYRNLGLLQADFYTTVFDETGRPVSRLSTANIYTQPVFFGIGRDDNYYYALNQPIHFPLIALDRAEKIPDPVPAMVEVVKHEYRTVISKSGSYFRYESQEQDKLIVSNIVTVGGENTNYDFVPRSPGDYEIRVSIPGANSYTSRSFYSYGGWSDNSSSFEVNNEGNIDIQLDKSSYNAGETAKVLFKTPFSGRMLVTMETDKMLSYQYVNVDQRTASLDLKLSGDAIPNAYVTATLFKPHGISDIPLTVAHGFQNISVTEKNRRIPVEIFCEKAVRTHTRQRVTVRALSNSMISLAAVDNGVLQVSGFETPDPYAFFYAKRALAVNAYDLYPLLLPELKARLSTTGGDAEGDMNKRTNPMPAKRIKILSYWSGTKKANSSGEATFEFDIPQFSGEVRLMAVAYRNERFGGTDATMKVADPIVLSTALPRFLSPADSITVPVTITNTSSKPAEGSAVLKTTGSVQVSGVAKNSFSIAPNSEKRLYYSVIAKPEMGIARISVEVTVSGEKFTDETDISVRAASSLEKISASGELPAGGSIRFVHKKDYIPSSVSAELVLSRFPAVGLTKWLAYLVHYPYGCTEQTVSTAFPQLYAADMGVLLHVETGSGSDINSNIEEAVRKIKMRQLYSGGVTLWDNEGSENWWTTVYAAHFLVEAGKAGFEVDKNLLETILGYVNAQLKNKKTIPYYYNRDQQKKIVPKEVIYGLYVLALAGRPNISVMNYYKANPALLSLDCKYLLAAAYALTGDQKSFQQFLPTQFAGEESLPQSGGSFYSDIRDESIALNVLVDVDPANAQIPVMAKHIADKFRQRDWFSTQEAAFGFLALGKIARQATKTNATATVTVNGRTVGTMEKTDLKLTTAQLTGGDVVVDVKGTGKLYYYTEEEGISTTGTMKEEDSYLKVRKRFFDRFGKPLAGNSFKQNDLVVVQLTLEKSFSGSIDNVVITDLLPAGFEIENPRTKDLPGMEWIKDGDSPTALDLRDDRINLFVDLDNQKQTYYYAVRAVSPGIFKMGPVSADAMYNGEYHSYHGAGTIRVLP
jgi:alpha-2-macroglobulin